MSKFKKWIFPEEDTFLSQKLAEKFGISELVAKILLSRGFDLSKTTEDFLNKNSEEFHNPFLLHDMQKAVDTITSAIDGKEKIAVYGDYDVDGITSTYIILDYLNSLGADIIYYIPDRISEGYGINKTALEHLHNLGVSLVITVDSGITALSEVEYAKTLGMTFVITDHHNLKEEIPNAAAVVNPKIPSEYPFDVLAGVGVAFKLVYALSDCDKKVFDKYCDIAAIGTIADMVPLCGENRFIASCGIEMLKNTKNIGIRALLDISGTNISDITSTDISFIIAPRINAAGRIASASMSVELLLEKGKDAAEKKAMELDNCNKLRQKEEQAIFEEALKIIEENHYYNDDFIIVAKENWKHGVIGIVSSKITEMFYRPSSVISINDDGTGKASGRSIKGVNLFDALSSCSLHLVKFGGHELAAGFTIKDGEIENFRKSINESIKEFMTEEITTPSIAVDAKITLKDISLKVVDELKILEPYGIGNKEPLLCLENIKIKNIRYTANKKHAFLTVNQGDAVKEIPAFSMAEDIKDLKTGDIISAVGFLSVNTFKGITEAQFIVRDIHKVKSANEIDRKELALIFGFIRKEIEQGNNIFSKLTLMPENNRHITYCFKKFKLETALKIFCELEILEITESESSLFINKGKNFSTKTNLEDSETYKKFCNTILASAKG